MTRMRTTLELDDSLVAIAKSIARDEGTSIGAVISRLARRGLEHGPRLVTTKSGFPHLEAPDDAPIVTLEMVNRYRDDD